MLEVRNNERNFIFDHVPKTAGTSFRGALESIFGKSAIAPHVEGKTQAWAMRKYARYRVISGHFEPVSGDLLNRQRAHLTILRHPLERLVSEYFFFRNDVREEIPGGKAVALAKTLDIPNYVRVLEACERGCVSNVMCRHFARKVSREFTDGPQMLAYAKQALESFDFVGICESMADSLALFSARFGLPAASEVPRLNATSSRPGMNDLGSGLRDKLAALNELDLELYEHAVAMFAARRRVGPPVAEEVAEEVAGGAAEGPVLALSVDAPAAGPAAQPSSEAAALRVQAPEAVTRSESFGDRTVEITEVRVVGAQSGTASLGAGEEMVIHVVVEAHVDVADLTVGIEISDAMGEVAFGTNTHLLKAGRGVSRGSVHQVDFRLPADLNLGRYFVTVAAHRGGAHSDGCFHWRDRAARFDVVDYRGAPFVGYARLHPKVGWEARQERARQERGEAPVADGARVSANPVFATGAALLSKLRSLLAAEHPRHGI